MGDVHSIMTAKLSFAALLRPPDRTSSSASGHADNKVIEYTSQAANSALSGTPLSTCGLLPALPGPQRSFWAFDLGLATDIALLVYCSVIGVWHVVMLSKVVLDRVLVVIVADFGVAHKQLSLSRPQYLGWTSKL
jgi:hypothetical protein